MKKTVLITGSSIGLGASIATLYAQKGYNIVITYLTHEKEALELSNNLEKEYNINTLVQKCDISSESDLNNLKENIIKTFNNLDVLVNNAAVNFDNDFNSKTKEEFMRVLEVNLVGTFLVSRIFGNMMLEQKKGSIINIASNNGIDAYYEESLDYDASKAGIINLTHNLANHYSPYVRVNAICPGWINTGVTLNPELEKKELEKIMLKRFARPEEIASLVFFLGSDEASYMTDSIIKIDGGKIC